jgi:hypothetical protein
VIRDRRRHINQNDLARPHTHGRIDGRGAIEADLTGLDEPLQPSAGQCCEVKRQQSVEALATLVIANRDALNTHAA